MESASLLPRSTALSAMSVPSRHSVEPSRRLRCSKRQVWRRATVTSQGPRRLSSERPSRLWIRMVKVTCAMSAASSRVSPYLKGMEYTRPSYLFNNWCHAPTLPCRQRRTRSQSETTPLRAPFTSTICGQPSPAPVGYHPPDQCELGLSGTLYLPRLLSWTPLV